MLQIVTTVLAVYEHAINNTVFSIKNIAKKIMKK